MLGSVSLQRRRESAYVVPLDKDRLDGAPRYPQNEVPPYSSEYGRTVGGYCGSYL